MHYQHISPMSHVPYKLEGSLCTPCFGTKEFSWYGEETANEKLQSIIRSDAIVSFHSSKCQRRDAQKGHHSM